MWKRTSNSWSRDERTTSDQSRRASQTTERLDKMQDAKFIHEEVSCQIQPDAPRQGGILSILPSELVPFGELIRINKPAGFVYLYNQCASGTLMAASMSDPVIAPSHLVATNLVLMISSLLFRSTGCSWDDTVDKDIDQKVSRTRLRPVARGAVSTHAAHICTISLLFLSLASQSQLPVSTGKSYSLLCVYYSIPFVVAAGVYPFLKRITHYPQVLLGFMNAWGVVLAFPALGMDLFTSTDRLASTSCLVTAVIAWTVINDTIYSFQDLRDDVKFGVMSMSVRFQKKAKIMLGGFAAIQVCSMLVVGIFINAGLGYFTLVSLLSLLLGILIRKVVLEDPESCAWWFHRGCHFGGTISTACFLVEYLLRV